MVYTVPGSLHSGEQLITTLSTRVFFGESSVDLETLLLLEPTACCCMDLILLVFHSENDRLVFFFFSPFRSSWPNQPEDPNLLRAGKTSMRTIERDAVQLTLLQRRNALPWIHKTFSTCLFKAQQFGLFCRNGHILVNKVICESQMYGWHSLLFMFLVPNKRHLGCHVTLWILFSFNVVAELCSVIVDQSNYLYSTRR